MQSLEKRKNEKNLKRLTFREISTLYYESIMTKQLAYCQYWENFIIDFRKEVFSYENAFTMEECMEQLCMSQRTVQRYLENEELDKIIVKTKMEESGISQ